MKYWLVSTLAALLLTENLIGQLSEEDYRSQELVARGAEPCNYCPYATNLFFDVTGKARVNHDDCKHNRFRSVQFAQAEIDVSKIFYYNPYCDEGLIATGAYNYMYLHWKNPNIRQKHFHTLSVAIGGFSHRVCNWIWEGEVRFNATINHYSFCDYLTCDLMLAGRYAMSDCFGIHAGFIALTGMKVDHVYPVVGFDWQLDDRWKLNLVFPTNLSLVYSFGSKWSMELAGRFFDERHRAGNNQHLKRGIVEYRAGGIEAGVNYISCSKNLHMNFHFGGLIGGSVKVSNRHHSHSHRHRFGGTPYAGGDIAFRF
jgi:hypothetical protein